MIFPTQGSNPGLPHCRWILYQLRHQGSPRTLEWVAYHLSRESSQPRYPTKVSCSAGGFFTSWATREAQLPMINTQLKCNKISYIIPQPRRTKNKGNSKNNNYWSMIIGIPWWLSQWNVYPQFGRPGFYPWVGKIPWRRKWQATPVPLPRKLHGWQSLVDYSPWGCKELDTTERLHFTSVIIIIPEVFFVLFCFVLLVSLQTISASEGVEKGESSYAVNGNVNWYKPYGEQYEDSLKN